MRSLSMPFIRSRRLDASLLALGIVLPLLTSCGNHTIEVPAVDAPAAQRAETIGQSLMLRVAIDENDASKSGVDCAALGADWASCAQGRLIFENRGASPIATGGWSVYLHSIRRVLAVQNAAFKLEHVTGDLHRVTPASGAFTLAPGARIEVPFVAEYWFQRVSDVLPRAYVVVDDSTSAVLAANDTDDETRYIERLPANLGASDPAASTPAQQWRRAAEAQTLPASLLAARPVPDVVRNTAATGALAVQGVALSLAGLSANHLDALNARAAALGLSGARARVSGRIAPAALPADIALPGGYRLAITPDGVRIDAFDETGLYYAVQTLFSLTPAGGGTVPAMTLEDAPRYPHRGMMVDVARNFRQPDTLHRLIDQMSAYKLNRLHLHLSDDEGWRIEIPGLPELTAIGARRCHDPSETHCLLPQLGSGPANQSGGGYLSRDTYIALVRYAADRFVDVMPEIDMPAHARAAVVSMEARYRRLHAAGDEAGANAYRLLDPQDTSQTLSVQFYDRRSYLNPCTDGARNFAGKVIAEIAAMHREAGAPLSVWHFGGDEAKNILLGAGFQALDGSDPGKGRIDVAKQDQPWARSPMCASKLASGAAKSVDELPTQFARTVSQMVAAQSIGTMGAWQDGVRHASGPQDFATTNTLVTMWDTLFWDGTQTTQDFSAKGYRTVLALPDYLYFDFPYTLDPLERGYYWGSRATDSFKVFSLAPDNLPQNAEVMPDRDGNAFEIVGSGPAPRIEGIQGQAWAEVIRNDAQFEYMVYPRLLVLAERAWHRAGWERPWRDGERFRLGETDKVDKAQLAADWATFMQTVEAREEPKLARAAIGYRAISMRAAAGAE